MADEAPAATPQASAPAPTTAPAPASAPPSAAPMQPTGAQAQTAPATPAAPEPLDPVYLAKGGRWKMSEEQLREIPRHIFDQIDAAADAEVIESLHRLGMGGQPGNGQVPPPTNGRAMLPPQQPPVPQYAAPQADASSPFTAIALNMEDADDDAPAVQHAKALNEGMTKNFNTLYQHFSAQMQQMANAVQALHRVNDFAVVDRHLSELGDEWSDVFGKGQTLELDPNTPSYAQRMAFYDAARKNLVLSQQLGRPVDRNDAFARARYQLYSKKIAELERTKREARAKEAANSLPAPTGAPHGAQPAMGLRASVHQLARELAAAR